MQSHIGDNRSGQIYATNVVCALAAYIAVLLRLIARSLTTAKYGRDDWLIAAGLVRMSLLQLRLITESSPDPIHWLYYLKQPHHSLWHGKTYYTGYQREGFDHCNTCPHSMSVGNAYRGHRH